MDGASMKLNSTQFLISLALVLLSPVAGAITYTYDVNNRLTSVVYDNGQQITYTYDATGNMLTLASTGSAADCLFNWAERTVPQYFAPAGAASVTLTPYYYRYYTGTKNYLATSSADNHIWVLGLSFGSSPLDVGPMTSFTTMAGCSQ